MGNWPDQPGRAPPQEFKTAGVPILLIESTPNAELPIFLRCPTHLLHLL